MRLVQCHVRVLAVVLEELLPRVSKENQGLALGEGESCFGDREIHLVPI